MDLYSKTMALLNTPTCGLHCLLMTPWKDKRDNCEGNLLKLSKQSFSWEQFTVSSSSSWIFSCLCEETRMDSLSCWEERIEMSVTQRPHTLRWGCSPSSHLSLFLFFFFFFRLLFFGGESESSESSTNLKISRRSVKENKTRNTNQNTSRNTNRKSKKDDIHKPTSHYQPTKQRIHWDQN